MNCSLITSVAACCFAFFFSACQTIPPVSDPQPKWVPHPARTATLPSGEPAIVLILKGPDEACSEYTDKRTCFKLWQELPRNLPALGPDEDEIEYLRDDEGTLRRARIRKDSFCAMTERNFGDIPCEKRWEKFFDDVVSRERARQVSQGTLKT